MRLTRLLIIISNDKKHLRIEVIIFFKYVNNI